MVSTKKILPAHDFNGDPDGNPQNAKIQSELDAIRNRFNELIDALNRFSRGDDQITDEHIRLFMLHPELIGYLETGDATLTDFVPSTETKMGSGGLVPAPPAGLYRLLTDQGWSTASNARRGMTPLETQDFEDGGVGGFTLYENPASAIPGDGTGAPGANATLTAQQTNVITGNWSLQLDITSGNGLGYGIRKDVNIGTAAVGKPHYVSLKVGNLDSGLNQELAVFVYDVTNARNVIEAWTEPGGKFMSPGAKLLDTANPTQGDIGLIFTPENAGDFRILVHCRGAQPVAPTYFTFDDFEFGQYSGDDVAGARYVGPWMRLAWRNSAGGQTADVANLLGRQVGQEIEIRGPITFAALIAGDQGFQLPGQLRFDTEYNRMSVGSVRARSTPPATDFYDGTIYMEDDISATYGSDGAVWTDTSPAASLREFDVHFRAVLRGASPLHRYLYPDSSL